MIVRDTRPDNGFTLLEMLVVLALLAIFVATLAGSLRVGVLAEAHVSVRAESDDTIWRAERFLRDRLGNAQPVWVRDGHKGWVEFAGDADEMRFLAPTPESLGGIGLSRYQLEVDTEDAHSRLLARVLTARPEEAVSREIGSAVLLTDVLSIRFAYYGKLQNGGQMDWQSSWNERSEMPQLISIHVDGRAGKNGTALDVIVRPRIDIDVECQLDVHTASCEGH